MYSEHRGCRLAYAVSGSGPAGLFIQGVGVAGSGWRPQVEAFASRFTCVSFDNRGMGKSQPRGRTRSLALLSTFGGGRDVAPLTARMMWHGLRSRVGTRAMRRRGFLGLVMPPGPIDDPEGLATRLAELFGHDLADQPPAAAEQLRALRASDLFPRLSELAGLPTLVVTGRHDPIAPPSAGRRLAGAIPGARYVEVDKASHGLPITHAALTNELLAEHFDRANS